MDECKPLADGAARRGAAALVDAQLRAAPAAAEVDRCRLNR